MDYTKSHTVVAKDGTIIAKGDRITDFRGASWVLVDWSAPRHAGSTGRVYVVGDNGSTREFYPTVFDARIVPA